MKKGISLLIAVLFSLFILINSVTAHEKTIEIKINDDGSSDEKIIWKININDRFSYLPMADWTFSIPKQTSSISVKDSKGELPFTIIYLRDNDNFNMLKLKNREPLFYNSQYYFEIRYHVKKNPVIYEPYYFYKRTLTRSENDDKLDLSFSIPLNAEIFSMTESQSEKKESDSLLLRYEIKKGETKTVQIDFKIPNNEPKLKEISSEYFTINVPERYELDYKKILEKADKGVKAIEKIYGFNSPFKWQIKIILPEDKDYSENFEGFYLGDARMRIKADQVLAGNEKEIIYIILHETVHGFNSKFFSDKVPNFWWNEGTAQYVALKALEEIKYNITDIEQQDLGIIAACQDNIKSLVTGWSPNTNLEQKDSEINCGKEKINSLKLGYAYSFYIVYTITKEFGDDIFSKFYKTAELLQINFSSDKKILNNQVGFVLTKAIGKDSTEILNKLNLDVEKINPNDESKIKSLVTGMQIQGEEKIDELKVLIALLIFITIVLMLLTLKRKNKKPRIRKAVFWR